MACAWNPLAQFAKEMLNEGRNVGFENVPTNCPVPYVNIDSSVVTCHDCPKRKIDELLELIGIVAPLLNVKSLICIPSHVPSRPPVWPYNDAGSATMTPSSPKLGSSVMTVPDLNETVTLPVLHATDTVTPVNNRVDDTLNVAATPSTKIVVAFPFAET